MCCRVAGLIVSLAASSRKVKVSVEAVGFLVIRGVTLTFAQVCGSSSVVVVLRC